MTMNEKSWSLKSGKDQTEVQHRRHKRERCHGEVKRKYRWNKKAGELEKSKKGNKEVFGWRCS